MADQNGSSGRLVTTFREVAEHLGVTPSQVSHWSEAGMPRRREGRHNVYDLVEIAGWLVGKGKHVHGTPRAKKEEAEARLKTEQARKAARENRVAEERIVDLEDVDRFFSEFFLLVREVLERVPTDMRMSFHESLRDENESELKTRLQMVLRTLKSQGQKIGEIGVDK